MLRKAIRYTYALDVERLARPDLIIGSGRPSIALGIWLRSYFHSMFVFSGHARTPQAQAIDVQLVNCPRVWDSPSCAVTPLPGIIDRTRYDLPKRIATSSDLEGAVVGLAIGGNSHSHRFDAREWKHLLWLVEDLRRRYRVRWRITTSRRSPASLVGPLRTMERAGIVEEFVDFRERGLASARELFGSDFLIVTEDSLSMLSEGLAAGRAVIALRPKRTRHCEMSEVVAYQAGQGWLASIPIASVTPEIVLAELVKLRLPERSVQEHIRVELASRIESRLLVGENNRAKC